MQKASCPICHSDIMIGDEVYEGDIFECTNCEAVSEVSNLHPMTLNPVEDESGNGEDVEKEEDEEE